MEFLTPLPWLWGALAAAGVAAPIIIHLLYRKHRKQTHWAAMELLRRALVTRSGQVRLENYLILFLRCLALLLIAAALMRPTINSNMLGQEDVGMVVAIDASFSMNHGRHSRFEKATARAKEILKTTDVGKPVTLLLMSTRPQILLRRTGYDPQLFNDVLDKQAKATPFRLGLEQNLEQLEELAGELRTAVKECYLITDGQKGDWKNLSDKAKSAFARLGKKANVFVTPIKSDGDANLSLTELGYASGSLHKSGVARIVAKVRNEGEKPSSSNIEFFVGDAKVARRALGIIKPGQVQEVSFFATFENPGDVPLRAVLTKDELTVDDERFAVVHIRPKIRILCIDDEPGYSAGARKGTYYAMRALRLLERGPGGPLNVHRVKSSDFNLEKLSNYDAILMANVAYVGPEMVERIDRFVRQGGGLIVFPGDRVNAAKYNIQFSRLWFSVPLGPETELDARQVSDSLAKAFSENGKPLPEKASVSVVQPGVRWLIKPKPGSKGHGVKRVGRVLNIYRGSETEGLLPAKLGKTLIADSEIGWSLGPVQSAHPLAEIVKRLSDEIIASARFSKAVEVEPVRGSETILTLTENRMPLLLARDVGAGSVLLFTTSADRTWNQLPIHPLYSMLLQQAVTNMTSRPETRNVTVGAATELAMPGRRVKERIKVIDPKKQMFETKVTESRQQLVCAIDTDTVGVYRIAAVEGFPAALVAANIDTSESNVRVASPESISSQLETAGVRVVADSGSLPSAIQVGRTGRELGTILLICGIVVFIAQSVLAKYFTNRMKHPDTDVAAALQSSRVAAARRS